MITYQALTELMETFTRAKEVDDCRGMLKVQNTIVAAVEKNYAYDESIKTLYANLVYKMLREAIASTFVDPRTFIPALQILVCKPDDEIYGEVEDVKIMDRMNNSPYVPSHYKR